MLYEVITIGTTISAQLPELLIGFWPATEMVEKRFVVVGDGKIIKIVIDKPVSILSHQGFCTVIVVIRFKQVKHVCFISYNFV